jgi:hypothetical protein
MLTFIFDTLIWVVGYPTARLTLPLHSFGRMYVEPLKSSQKGFNALGYRRDGSGRIEIEDRVAGGIGFVICFVACLAIAPFIRALA